MKMRRGVWQTHKEKEERERERERDVKCLAQLLVWFMCQSTLAIFILLAIAIEGPAPIAARCHGRIELGLNNNNNNNKSISNNNNNINGNKPQTNICCHSKNTTTFAGLPSCLSIRMRMRMSMCVCVVVCEGMYVWEKSVAEFLENFHLACWKCCVLTNIVHADIFSKYLQHSRNLRV